MQYYEPNFLDEALVLLDRFGSRAHILAGGTRLRFRLRDGSLRDDALVNIKRITDLCGIDVVDDSIRIGALVTAARLRRHPAVRDGAPLLAEAAGTMGAAQLQSVASVGGNVSSGDPASDLAVALLASGARCEIAAAGDGVRMLPIDDLLSRRPAFSPRELLTAVYVPVGQHRASYRKMTTRRGLEMALVAVAVHCRIEGDLIREARVGLAGAAPTVVRARAAERLLTGVRLGAEVAREAGVRAASTDAQPEDDPRASAAYRRSLVATLTERALMDIL